MQRPCIICIGLAFETNRTLSDLTAPQSPHSTHLKDQLRCAYDCYLAILREIDARVLKALDRSDSLGKNTHVCPPCFYKVKEEPSLVPAFLASIDGNNSLKLVDSAFRYGMPRTDNRTLPISRWLSVDQVDVFKDDVANAQNQVCLHMEIENAVSTRNRTITVPMHPERLHGSMFQKPMTFQNVLTRVLNAGRMPVLSRPRRCSSYSLLRVSLLLCVGMAMSL
jgi:hypothetical protein